MKSIRCKNFNDRHGQWATDKMYLVYKEVSKRVYFAKWTTTEFRILKQLRPSNEVYANTLPSNEVYANTLPHSNALSTNITVFELTDDEILIHMVAEEI